MIKGTWFFKLDFKVCVPLYVIKIKITSRLCDSHATKFIDSRNRILYRRFYTRLYYVKKKLGTKTVINDTL